MMRKYVTEFIGTFVLVFTVGCAVLTKSPLAPLAIGASLMVGVYAGGHISGGHYNPAVSFAAFVRGRLSGRDLVPYWIAQLVGGAVAAGLAVFIINPPTRHPVALTGRPLLAALLAEFIFAFVLSYVVLNVATSKDHPDNSFYGLAIGFTVMVGAVAVGGVSGGVFNPAVAFGGSLMGLFAWSNIWLYLVGNLAAGAVAGGVFLLLNPDDSPRRASRTVAPASANGTVRAAASHS
ncbi:MAG: aquaporin [Pseudonocardiales bacterium]|jgi:aquaporin Z|nr:aquaporin [Pseudonocardiales bacterium]